MIARWLVIFHSIPYILFSDMEIQVADTENSNAITKMVGHSAPVTGVSLDPLVKYLVRILGKSNLLK